MISIFYKVCYCITFFICFLSNFGALIPLLLFIYQTCKLRIETTYNLILYIILLFQILFCLLHSYIEINDVYTHIVKYCLLVHLVETIAIVIFINHTDIYSDSSSVLWSIVAIVNCLYYIVPYYVKYLRNTTRVSPSTYLYQDEHQNEHQNEIELLEEIVVTKDNTVYKNETCCICLDTLIINQEEILVKMPNCIHIFHKECGNKSWQSKKSCPLCRK